MFVNSEDTQGPLWSERVFRNETPYYLTAPGCYVTEVYVRQLLSIADNSINIDRESNRPAAE
jgi:hypothetical protein